jgi:hypothetical protein
MFVAHPKPLATSGNQKCTGAAPIFTMEDTPIRIADAWGTAIKGVIDVYINKSPIKRREEAKAWVRKYFKAASAENFLDLVIIGMKDSKFSSSPTQTPNQVELEMVIKVPVVSEAAKSNEERLIFNRKGDDHS